MNQEQQGTRGAIILQWEQGPGSPQVPELLNRSLRYFEQLQRDNEITSYRVYMDINGARGNAILEGQVDRLVDLVKRPDHRNFLITAQSTLPGFSSTTAIGGTNGAVEEVLQLVSQVQQQRRWAEANQQNQEMERRGGSERQDQAGSQREFATIR